MNTSLLRNVAIYSLGLGLFCVPASLRADDPAPKAPTSKETRLDDGSTPTKRHRITKQNTATAQAAASAKNKPATVVESRQDNVPTGTHLPRKTARRGDASDRDPATDVYDRNDIRFHDSDTVGDALRQVPGVNVGGRR